MWTIARAIREAAARLFQTRNDRLIVAGLVALAAAVSVAELGTAQLFSVLILPGESRSQNELIVLAVSFFVVFGLLRVINYAQSVYRITVVEAAFSRAEHPSRQGESWRWATAIELVAILTLLARLAVIAAGMFLFSPIFAAANILVSLIILEVLGSAVRRQHAAQLNFLHLQRSKKAASNADRVRTRIKAGELGALLASVGIMVLFGVLIGLTIADEISTGPALVIFLAVRMEGQIYTGLSTGLMRFVRAWVNSE